MAAASAVNIGASAGKGWEARLRAELIPTLEVIAKQRSAEAPALSRLPALRPKDWR